MLCEPVGICNGHFHILHTWKLQSTGPGKFSLSGASPDVIIKKTQNEQKTKNNIIRHKKFDIKLQQTVEKWAQRDSNDNNITASVVVALYLFHSGGHM